MTDSNHSLEVVFQIWDDKTGERVEVGPDRDGLDLTEIRQYTDDGQCTQRITLPKEAVYLLNDALNRILER
jgi:hypothetical protein